MEAAGYERANARHFAWPRANAGQELLDLTGSRPAQDGPGCTSRTRNEALDQSVSDST